MKLLLERKKNIKNNFNKFSQKNFSQKTIKIIKQMFVS